MPTDLNGTPTSLGIGTYNVDSDAPSGLGFNEAMAQIDALIAARVKVTGTPTGGQVPVWNATNSDWEPGSISPAPATTLPASPSDKQQAILVDSTTAATYAWLLQYSVTAGKWLCIGGDAALVLIDNDEIVTGNAYVDAPTPGPSFTVPRAGTYNIVMGVSPYADSTSATPFATLKLGAAAASDNESIGTIIPTANAGVGSFSRAYTRSLTASEVIKVQYRGNGVGNNHFRYRWLSVKPVAVT